MLRRAVHRLRVTLAGTLILAATATPAYSQGTTGKIQGRVVNQAGEPIAAAQVSVEGTTLGNISNDDGYYFINEVPAGLTNVRAQSIGYRAVVVQEQRVLAGQTTTINFTLEQAAVELEAITVEGERNPLVPRDQVSSKAIVTGETIDRLPLDNSNSVILLQPGVIAVCTSSGNCGARSIRGSRPGDEAVFVDGVPIRRMETGTTETVEVPTNALEQVDVTTGGFSARFGNAQSGVINYVTRSGGPTFGGSVSFMTDELAPLDWRGGFNRAELSLGGPIPFVPNLSFFFGATAEGNKYAALPQDIDDVGFFVPSGVDTTFRVERSSSVAGASDSVDVIVPNFVRWDNGNRSPTRQQDEYNITTKLTYGLPGGSKLDLTYYRNRDQILNRGLSNLYNPDAWDANASQLNMLTLGGYFILAQSAEQALALDVKASYQNDFRQQGDVDKQWLQSHLDPAFGFNFGNHDFLLDPDDWPVTQTLVDITRSGVLPEDSLKILPGTTNLSPRQGVAGLAESLRLNPYGMRSNWTTSGVGNDDQNYQREKRWYLSATADWQMSRFNRLWIGGDVTLADVETMSVPLTDGRLEAAMFDPKQGGIFLQDRLDLGDVVLEAGLRWDYFDPAGNWPRIPGYVFNVPDSLKADFVRIRSGTEPILDRVEPLENCGGDATAPDRRRADGTLVCKNNFVEAESRSTLSPRIAVSFPVTASSTFRLSYGQNTQTPALTPAGGIFDAVYNDLQGGNANTNTLYGRNIETPRTILFEAGYRQVFGGNTVVDVSAYSKTTRNALTYRKIQYRDPNEGNSIFINSLTNSDYSLARGVDVRFDRRFSEIADLTLNYSFLDARGTGSNPDTYTGLILRRNTNLSILTGNPVDPPELLLTLDQSRAHTVSSTFSLLFPSDYMEGSSVANAILGNVGIFATARVSSGLPFTLLRNSGNGQTGPPTDAGLGGIPAEDLNASRTPSEKRFDLRMTKGIAVGSNQLRVFADWRNPLNLGNTTELFLETGTITNAAFRTKEVEALMVDATLDGDPNIDDFDIELESPANAVNKYLLKQAEARFGDGNGVFSVDEQRAAFGSFYNLFNGPQWYERSDQLLRLGIEFVF